LRTKRALALALIVIVSALLLAELFYATPNLFYWGSVIVRAYAIGSYGLLVWLTNASFSVWAWAPTPNGTEFMPIYNGTGFQAVIGLSKLASWAEDWVHAYGKVAIGVFEPSIIIWVSYYIRLPNGSVELVAQPFYRPINLSLPLSGGWGVTVNAVMGRPFITVVKASGATAKGSGKASALSPPFYVVPHVIAWYPNDTGMAPISLAVALAQPSPLITSFNEGIATVDIVPIGFPAIVSSVTLPGSEFEAALRDAESGNLLQAVRTLSPVMGPVLNYTNLSGNFAAVSIPPGHTGIAQLYIVGQGALVNWTEQSASGRPVTWYLSLQLTEARIAKFKLTKFVSYTALGLYYWEGYDPCVNLSEWAHEQQIFLQNSSYFFKAGMNSTCPLPNTPAPVIWQDYATNLTYYATLKPGGGFVELSYELSHGVNGTIISPLGAGIDLGSAIASVMEGKDFGQPGATASADLMAGVLVPFQYLVFNEITVSNNLPRGYYVNVYFNDLTPVYYNASGYGFTLPGKLVLINVSSSP